MRDIVSKFAQDIDGILHCAGYFTSVRDIVVCGTLPLCGISCAGYWLRGILVVRDVF